MFTCCKGGYFLSIHFDQKLLFFWGGGHFNGKYHLRFPSPALFLLLFFKKKEGKGGKKAPVKTCCALQPDVPPVPATDL